MPQITKSRTTPAGRILGNAGKTNVTLIVLIVVLVVVLAAVVTFFYLITHQKNIDVTESADGRATVVSSDNAQAVKAAMEKPVEDGSYQVTMNLAWVFDGKSSNAYVENSKDNTRTVYFDVFRADTKELVFSSPYIPVGEKMKGFVLDKALPQGSYNGLVTYHLVDDDHKEISTLSVTITMQVK